MTENTEQDTRRIQSIANTHMAAAAAEADRIRATLPADKISPALRVSLGYADNARNAANRINEK